MFALCRKLCYEGAAVRRVMRTGTLEDKGAEGAELCCVCVDTPPTVCMYVPQFLTLLPCMRVPSLLYVPSLPPPFMHMPSSLCMPFLSPPCM